MISDYWTSPPQPFAGGEQSNLFAVWTGFVLLLAANAFKGAIINKIGSDADIRGTLLFIIFLSHFHRNMEPNPCNCPRLSLLKSTTSPHPPSCATVGRTETIVVGGVPNRRAAPANNAPPWIQSRTCMPCDVKVLSELTKVSQEEVRANEILVHKSIH
ncbi:MAG: hypothetical protein WCF23_17205 [Candidatus Nitrosopolaris sp.]